MEDNDNKVLPVIGKVPKEWQVVTFGSLLLGNPRNGIYKPKEYHGRGTKIVNMGELFAYPRLYDVQMRRIELNDNEKERFDLQVGDLLFARRSLIAEGAGKCSIVCHLTEPTTFESSIIRVRPNPLIVDSDFLYYLFSSPYGKHQLGTILRQVAVSGITGSDLVNLTIPLPPLEQQKSFSTFLTSLDNKIDHCRKINQTLETLAQSIYKSWFIDFDPVRDKMEGREPVGIDTETANLFPNSMNGEIPIGWKHSTIGDEVRVVGGGTPSTKDPDYWENGIFHWVTPKDLSALHSPVLLDTERYITQSGLNQISSGLLPTGTVLLSSRAPIGYIAISEVPVAINQGFIAMVCDRILPNYYIWLWVRENMEIIKSRANGTTFQEISKSNFRPIPILVPSNEVLSAFVNFIDPIFQRIVSNLKEAKTLSELRDTLIPKFMNGEVKVS
jgi:type I restriction enzyme S subunit